MKSSTRIRCTPWQPLWDSVAVRLCIHNPLPFVQTHDNGSRLAHGVFEALRRDGKRVIAKCPFMSSYAAQHPEYGALLDG
jgi:hypothetical protein